MRRPTFHIFTTAFTLAIAGCKKEPLPPPPPPPVPSASALGTSPVPSTVSTAMRPGQRCSGTIVSKLKPKDAVDYLELRLDYYPQNKREIVVAGSQGEACKGARDESQCKTALAQVKAERSGEYLVYTRGDEIKTVNGAAIGPFLIPIESPEEAALTLVQTLAADSSAAAVWPSCDPAEYRQTEDGWEMTHTSHGICEEKTVTSYSISKAGMVKLLKTEHTPKKQPCEYRRGRRPEGLALSTRSDGATLGGHLAEAAEMEAASVPAFERLEAELRALQAPITLRRRAKRAAADEVRHAETMTTLAARFGASPRDVALDPIAPRALVDMAIENAVEGCVFETWAALVAHWQAEHARDVGIRSAMKTIARDETRHAALAWDVDTFLASRLSEVDRRRVEGARADAFACLEAMLEEEPSEELRALAGLPSAGEARALLEQLLQVVDHAAAAAA